MALVMVIIVSVVEPPPADAASDTDIDRMPSYAVIFGRAAGCGINTEKESRRAGEWMDRVFPPGSKDQKTYLPVFIEGMTFHARQQAAGKSPDSCAEMRRQVRALDDYIHARECSVSSQHCVGAGS